MSLFLVESTISAVSNKEQFEALVENVHATEGTGVIEVQVAKDLNLLT